MLAGHSAAAALADTPLLGVLAIGKMTARVLAGGELIPRVEAGSAMNSVAKWRGFV